MLSFDLFCNDYNYQERKVSLNPKFIASVLETERRPAEGFYQPVAVITIDSGERYTVYDHDRTASKRIKEAQSYLVDAQRWRNIIQRLALNDDDQLIYHYDYQHSSYQAALDDESISKMISEIDYALSKA